MKLLICTQAMDSEDSVLGFFVRWIEEFAQHCEKVTVICLRAGKYSLPSNVEVTVLGSSRLARVTKLWSLSLRRKGEYDTVFVHMNPEYIVAAGLLWRLMGKRVALWYTHKSVNLKLRIAVLFASIIFTASKESFRLRTKKLHVMGHGIDTDFFSPDPSVARGDWALSVGRLMPSKRHDLAIQMAIQEGGTLRIAGEGPERAHLEALARKLHAPVQFLGALTRVQLRDEYRTAAHLIHTSETGSLDKVVLEALACGMKVTTHDPALKSLENEGQQYVLEHHSLQSLIPRVLTFIGRPTSDPRTFYDTVMPEKLGGDYERARWKAHPLLSAQYRMMTDVLNRSITPNVRHAWRVIEVGPGPGTWTKLLLEANPDAEYTLVDISKEMLAQTREVLAGHAKVSFVESDLLAFESLQPFDFFFSSRAVEYMPDKRAAVRKIASLIAPDAHGAIITKMPKPFFNQMRGRQVAALHTGQITPRNLARILTESGLIVDKVRIATATLPGFGSARANGWIYALLKHLPLFFPLSLLAESYIVIFRKPL
jgi:SAM-dependent methyltransferase